MRNDIVKQGIYEHYKGKKYLVLGCAQHTETQEPLVVYVPLYEHSGYGMCVRPLEMFLEDVEIEHKITTSVVGVCLTVGTKRVPRFRYLGDSV